MELSIIIPVYEPEQDDIIRCLESIYSQNIDNSLFEVICIDDCSPTQSAKQAIDSYNQNKNLPNLSYYRHNENKRQGGARNTGIKIAKGKFIGCIDQDDFFMPGSLSAILKSINLWESLDIIMFDHSSSDNKCNIINKNFYSSNTQDVKSGNSFLRSNEITWMPWAYVYKKEFIKQHNISFEENVRFEDVDFIMKAISLASTIKYEPFSIIAHRETSAQTSQVGNSSEKIIDLVKIALRVGNIAKSEFQKNNNAAEIIIKHHDLMYLSAIKRNIWRLSCRSIFATINNYPPMYEYSSNQKIKFIGIHPKLTSAFLCCIKPLLKTSYRIYKKFK